MGTINKDLVGKLVYLATDSLMRRYPDHVMGKCSVHPSTDGFVRVDWMNGKRHGYPNGGVELIPVEHKTRASARKAAKRNSKLTVQRGIDCWTLRLKKKFTNKKKEVK